MAKILLVEDDTNLSEIYQARMEAEGYTVVAAPDGESALALAAKEKPDLIISDVMMPKISGFEMLDILRNTDGLKGTRVIMLTALGQAEDRARAEHLGADKYLVKSQVTLEDIVSAAQELLGDAVGDVPPAPVAAPAPADPADTSDALDPADSPTVAPSQPAPTGPLAATTPALMPVAEPPVAAPATPVETPGLTSPATPAAAVSSEESEELTVTTPTAVPTTEEQPVSEVIPVPASEQPVNEVITAPASEPLTAIGAEPVVPVAEPAPASTVTAETPTPDIPTETAPAVATPASVETSAIPAPTPTPALETIPVTAEPVAAPPVEPATEATPPQPALPATPAAEAVAEVVSVAPVPTPAPEPTTAPATEQPVATSAASASTTPPIAPPIDEDMVANAIDKLLAKSPSGASASAAAPAPNEVPATSATEFATTPVAEQQSETHRTRVIAPPSHPDAPNLQDLLAKEEAQQVGSSVQPTVAAPIAVAQQPATTSKEAADAALLAKAQAENSGQPKVAANSFDPNNITL